MTRHHHHGERGHGGHSHAAVDEDRPAAEARNYLDSEAHYHGGPGRGRAPATPPTPPPPGVGFGGGPRWGLPGTPPTPGAPTPGVPPLGLIVAPPGQPGALDPAAVERQKALHGSSLSAQLQHGARAITEQTWAQKERVRLQAQQQKELIDQQAQAQLRTLDERRDREVMGLQYNTYQQRSRLEHEACSMTLDYHRRIAAQQQQQSELQRQFSVQGLPGVPPLTLPPRVVLGGPAVLPDVVPAADGGAWYRVHQNSPNSPRMAMPAAPPGVTMASTAVITSAQTSRPASPRAASVSPRGASHASGAIVLPQAVVQVIDEDGDSPTLPGHLTPSSMSPGVVTTQQQVVVEEEPGIENADGSRGRVFAVSGVHGEPVAIVHMLR